MSLFGKKDDGKGTPAEAVKLEFLFESDALIVQAEGLGRFKIEAADLGLLTDREAVKRALNEASETLTKRIYDQAAIERFCKVARLLSHGLGFDGIARLFDEPESDLRAFFNWALNQGGAYENVVATEKQKQDALDILPLIPERTWTGAWGLHKEVRVNGARVKKLLANDVDAATELGVQRADLDKWLGDNIEMMKLL